MAQKDQRHLSKIHVDEALVNYLEEVFPDRCPDFDTTEREVCFKAGQVSVVRMLRHHLERQQQNILKGEII